MTGACDLELKPRAVDVRRTALLFDVSPRTVKRWIADGLPILQQGPRHKVLIRPEDVEVFLQRRQINKPALDIVTQTVDEVLRSLATRQRRARRPGTGGTDDHTLTVADAR